MSTNVFFDDFTGAAGLNVGRVVGGQTYAIDTPAPPYPANGGFSIDGLGFLTCPGRSSAFYVGARNKIPLPGITGTIAASMEAKFVITDDSVYSKIEMVMYAAPAGAPTFSIEVSGGIVTLAATAGSPITFPSAGVTNVVLRVEADPGTNEQRIYLNDVLNSTVSNAFGSAFDGSSIIFLTGYTDTGIPAGVKVDSISIDTGVYTPPPPPTTSEFWTDFVNTYEVI